MPRIETTPCAWLAVVAALAMSSGSCTPQRRETPPPGGRTPSRATSATAARADPASEVTVAASFAPPPAPPQPEPLPDGIVAGEETRLAVDGDRAVIVVHAPAGTLGAIVYLHGVCGDPYAPRSWYDVATRYGTVITLLGDDACKRQPGRYRWRGNTELLHSRIDRALAATKRARGGQLDTDDLTLMGYSQGASGAEALALRIAPRCRRLLLGSPPSAPDPDDFAPTQSVAIVAGAMEGNAERREGVRRLVQSGRRATFLVLPGAHHGQYGEQGARVMSEALAWLHGGGSSPLSDGTASGSIAAD